MPAPFKDGYAALERRLGYKFRDKSLLRRALTHSSASRTDNYEQLEFLGDAVIQLVVTQALYKEGGNEGEMTSHRQRLVSHAPLKAVSEWLGLPALIIKGSPDVGEKALSSVYEAVAGAVFCDGGYKSAQKVVTRTLLAAHMHAPENFKGELQELMQARGRELPSYDTRRVGGTSNKPQFLCELAVCGKNFSGTGGSKAEAEQSAAERALKQLKR